MLLPFMQRSLMCSRERWRKDREVSLMRWVTDNLNSLVYTGDKLHDLGVVCADHHLHLPQEPSIFPTGPLGST